MKGIVFWTSSLSIVINNDPKNINPFDTYSLTTSFAFCCGHFQFARATGHPSSPLSPQYLRTKHIPASGKGCCTGSGTWVDHVSWRSADEKMSTQRTHQPKGQSMIMFYLNTRVTRTNKLKRKMHDCVGCSTFHSAPPEQANIWKDWTLFLTILDCFSLIWSDCFVILLKWNVRSPTHDMQTKIHLSWPWIK